MLKFNVVGGEGKVPTGTYTNHSSVNGRCDVSDNLKYINWAFDGTGTSGTFYIDEFISAALNDNSSEKKYGWLLEGKAIIPHIYNDVLQNLDSYINKFDMLFTSDKSIYDLHEKIKFVPANTLWVKDLNIYPKTKLLSMIASNKAWTHGHQLRVATKDKMIGKADIFGNGFNEIAKKEDGLKDYMFSIAIENSSYPTYFTEKILDCFATGTIPIYWGSPDIGDHFNANGIIMLDDFSYEDLTPELYYSKLDAVKENFDLFKKYILLENYISESYFA
jgi:hypothetical protein